jgi:hypothetical protein
MQIFWKTKCPSCKKSTGITGALLQIELAPRMFSCNHCGRQLTTNFETRVHITAYRLLVLGILAGFLLGCTLSSKSIFFRLYTLDISGLLTNEFPQLLIASALGLTAVGIPGLIYFAPIIQSRIDSVCEGKHSQIVAISPSEKKKAKFKGKNQIPELDNDTNEFFSFDTVVKPKRVTAQMEMKTNNPITPSGSGVAQSVGQQQRLGVKAELNMVSDKTTENSFYRSSTPPKDDRVKEMAETLDDLRIEVSF